MSDFFQNEIMDNSNSIITHSNSLSNFSDESQLLENQEAFQTLINNSFFTDLAEIMDNKEFTSFFDKHFNDKEEMKTTLLYMKLYREIQLKYKDKKSIDIDKMTTLYVINVIMNTPTLRRTVIKSMSEHYKDDKQIKKVISDSKLISS